MRADAAAPSGRLESIECIRGIAALAVTWFHLTNGYDDVVGASGALGWLGVDCFFVISGFVISLSLHRTSYRLGQFPQFAARRIVRLEPPYLISIGLVIALQYASALAPGFSGSMPDYTPAQIACHVFYLIPFTVYPWISPVYWSLAYEFAFYIVAGVTFPFLWHRTLAISIALACGTAVLIEAISLTGTPRVPLFLMGLASVRYYLGRDSWLWFGTALLCAATTMVVGGAPLSAAAGVATALLIPLMGRVPAPRTLLWLGQISYALYLTHVPIGGRIVNLGRRFIHGSAQELVLSVAAMIGCLVFAQLFHQFAERPFTDLSRRTLRSRRKALVSGDDAELSGARDGEPRG